MIDKSFFILNSSMIKLNYFIRVSSNRNNITKLGDKKYKITKKQMNSPIQGQV